VLLNWAWFSPLRKLQRRSRVEAQAESRDYNPLSNSDGDMISSTDRLTEFDVLSSSFYCGATRKSGVINSAIKFITTPFVCVFFCHFYKVVSLDDVHANQITNGLGIYSSYIWVNILCSFGVYLLGSLSCMVGIQRQAFALPLLLVTPVCIFLSSVHWACESSTIRSSCGYVIGIHHYHVLIIAAMLWIGLLAYVIVYIWKRQEETMVPEKELFIIPYTYNGKDILHSCRSHLHGEALLKIALSAGVLIEMSVSGFRIEEATLLRLCCTLRVVGIKLICFGKQYIFLFSNYVFGS
jgi:hypothetical protein